MEAIAQKVLDIAKAKGADLAEVFLLNSKELTVEVAKQEVENLKLAEERGFGLRVILKNRLGYAYSSDLSPEAIEKTVERAVYNSGNTVEDKQWNICEPVGDYKNLDVYDENIFQRTIEEKINMAREVEKVALQSDPRVKMVEKAVYQDAFYKVFIFNSLGLKANYQGSHCGLYGVAIGQDNNNSESGFGLDFTLKYNNLNPAKVGKEAGEKAVRMLGAKSIPPAKIPIVLDPYIMTELLGVLETAFSAESVIKGKSFLAGKDGKEVASPLVNIIDSGALEGQLGSSPFDGEGVKTGQTIVIKQGQLQGFLHNLYTANKMGVKSTGNAVRGSYKSTPEVGTTNFYLDKGKISREDLLKEIKRGVYVTEVMGMHTANPISGDFSLGASGLLIENGELTKPVKGIAIAGNLKELLMGIDAVADDLTFFVGKGAPTVRIQGITISGR